MNIKESDFDFESMKDKALKQLGSGESLYGNNGAFAPLMKKFLEAALEAEMESHSRSELRRVRSILKHPVTVNPTSSPSSLRNVRLS